MRRVLAAMIVSVGLLVAVARAQTPDGSSTTATAEDCACESQVMPATLAVVNGITISFRDIEKATGQAVRNLQRQVTEARNRELDLQINSKLLAAEAKKRGITTAKLLELEIVAKVKPPTDLEAQMFFNQNKSRIQGDFNTVKEDLLRFLLDERQQAAAKKFAEALRAGSETSVKVTQYTPPGDESQRAQVLATVDGTSITAGDVEDSLRPLIVDVQQKVYELRKNELDLNINDTLLAQEAQKRKVTTSALLDAEVKPKPVTEEQARAFFEQNKERVSGDFAQTREAIISYLQQAELRAAEREFVDKLRAAASIQVFLKAPEQSGQ